MYSSSFTLLPINKNVCGLDGLVRKVLKLKTRSVSKTFPQAVNISELYSVLNLKIERLYNTTDN